MERWLALINQLVYLSLLFLVLYIGFQIKATRATENQGTSGLESRSAQPHSRSSLLYAYKKGQLYVKLTQERFDLAKVKSPSQIATEKVKAARLRPACMPKGRRPHAPSQRGSEVA